jgi:hypothetical protein
MRRAYRMDERTFWWLCQMLKPCMKGGGQALPVNSPKTWTNGAANGVIAGSVCLAAALHYFAGGDPSDICGVFGIGNSDVHKSSWPIIDAVNSCKELAITFPKELHLQQELANGCKARSQEVDFDNCVGAIDGILIWIEKLKDSSVKDAESGQLAFFRGRKHKYGINMQAVCDAEGRCLYVDLGMPGRTSDYLAFAASNLHPMLEDDLLHPGFYIFGDNAYVNTRCMATPYTTSKGSQEDHNFFHSQLRITVVCSFGMLVNKWGLL